MKHVFLLLALFPVCLCRSQALPNMAMPHPPHVAGDSTWGHKYEAIHIGFSNYMYSRYPDALYFQCKPDAPSDMAIQKSLAFKHLYHLRNLDLGYERCFNNRFYMEGNWSMNPWTHDYFMWNMAAGAGYMYSLSRDERWLLCPHMDISAGAYRYKFVDMPVSSTVIVDSHTIKGINSIIFIDKSLCLTPALKLIYQYSHVSFYASVGYCVPVMKKEMIAFKENDVKSHKVDCANSDYVMDYEQHAIHENIIEDVKFLQASAGMIVRLSEPHHNLKFTPAQW